MDLLYRGASHVPEVLEPPDPDRPPLRVNVALRKLSVNGQNVRYKGIEPSDLEVPLRSPLGSMLYSKWTNQ